MADGNPLKRNLIFVENMFYNFPGGNSNKENRSVPFMI